MCCPPDDRTDAANLAAAPIEAAMAEMTERAIAERGVLCCMVGSSQREKGVSCCMAKMTERTITEMIEHSMHDVYRVVWLGCYIS